MATEAKRTRAAKRTAIAMHRQWNAAMDALETHYANALKALMDQAKHLDASLEAAGISHADRVMDVARRLDLSAARRAA